MVISATPAASGNRSASRAPADAKLLGCTVERIRDRDKSAEFTAVHEVPVPPETERHRFVGETLRDAGVGRVPMEDSIGGVESAKNSPDDPVNHFLVLSFKSSVTATLPSRKETQN